MAHGHATDGSKSALFKLALAAVGVVFGDIGTSPLYTLRECFTGHHALPLTEDNILGILSLIIWSITFVVTVKYVLFVMRIDNEGEGGVLALLALALRYVKKARYGAGTLVALGLFGAALFYGDSVITPAISVLSAMEGLKVATPVFDPFIVPFTLLVITGLFAIQSRGTEKVGTFFGPIVALWFIALALAGIYQIIGNPRVLLAINPAYAVKFFIHHGTYGFFTLGAVVLALTGAEALYADMGHFGRKPIVAAWLWFVMPALVLNYLGQGALLMDNPAALENPFYLAFPDWALYPMVLLATCASVIASQAVISGAFSITRAAMQLGYSPRMDVRHTSEQAIGQIYIPQVNWALYAIVVGLVIAFHSSSNLAAAYGIAVTGTMVITAALSYAIARHKWAWPRSLTLAVVVPFLVVDLAFLSANALKIADGGWFPLVMGGMLFVLMTTWKRGREIVAERLQEGTIPLASFFSRQSSSKTHRVAGTAVFMTANNQVVPYALLHNLKHNKVLHDRVILLTVSTENVPYVSERDRLVLQPLDQNFFRIQIRYGFAQDPNVPAVLQRCKEFGLPISMMETSFFLSRETLISTIRPGMATWREHLFISMAKNAVSATDFFKIPANRVVELGTQIEL
ncbi:putative potassium transport system protein kup [Elstera cyanobacteriorum]|uniref:Probable potassium transport system protein Kup n=1 Tax=Elstera cyanobacteriorum TaxID=2022747 RepID=A0A255XW19_9PROT|nr:potassium transporter Kup [Elstera cyanobacteriorum]OYQ21102.1 potassium transporter Kup [Elstera cyanobacteriorum]GGA01724.1 putative potassium transport system protein kup [Elstera cyanobacteriorum]